MSHSPTDQERAWDFGMVDADVIAFPVCKAREEQQWSAGRLSEPISYWHERNWIRWQPEGRVNYVRGIGNQCCLEGPVLQPRRRSRGR